MASTRILTFFENQTTDATSPVENITVSLNQQLQVSGNFDGATLIMEARQAPHSTFASIDTNFPSTGDSFLNLQFKPGTAVRFNIAGSGASTDLTVSIVD